MSAWVSKEWFDTDGSRRREKVGAGKRGIKAADRFVVEWIDPAGKRCREKITNRGPAGKKDADKRCAVLNSHLELGTYVAESKSEWGTFRDRYINDELPNKRSPRTREDYEATIKRFESICKPKKMSAIDDSMLSKYVAARKREKPKVANTTINKDLRTLRAVLGKAKKWKALPALPDFDDAMLDVVVKRRPYVTEKEFHAMYEACGVARFPVALIPAADWWRAILATAWGTGQRIGSLLGLRWENVHLDEGWFMLDASTMKTYRDKFVEFGPEVARHLRDIQSDDGRVFPWDHHRTSLYPVLREIQKAAGLDPKRKDFKMHAYRRSFVQFNYEDDPEGVRRQVGHSAIRTTEDHYFDDHPEHRRRRLRVVTPDWLNDEERDNKAAG